MKEMQASESDFLSLNFLICNWESDASCQSQGWNMVGPALFLLQGLKELLRP